MNKCLNMCTFIKSLFEFDLHILSLYLVYSFTFLRHFCQLIILLLSFYSNVPKFPPLSSSVCQLNTIVKDSQSVQVCLLSSVRVFFDVSSSLCRYYIWLMWKCLTVHSVLRYLFVSQWCTLRSSVAAKQPFNHWAADDFSFMLQPETLTSALSSKLCWLMCLSLSNCSSFTVIKSKKKKTLITQQSV